MGACGRDPCSLAPALRPMRGRRAMVRHYNIVERRHNAVFSTARHGVGAFHAGPSALRSVLSLLPLPLSTGQDVPVFATSASSQPRRRGMVSPGVMDGQTIGDGGDEYAGSPWVARGKISPLLAWPPCQGIDGWTTDGKTPEAGPVVRIVHTHGGTEYQIALRIAGRPHVAGAS